MITVTDMNMESTGIEDTDIESTKGIMDMIMDIQVVQDMFQKPIHQPRVNLCDCKSMKIKVSKSVVTFCVWYS